MNINIETTRRWCYRKSTLGWSVRLIASHLGRPKSTVHRWITWGRAGRSFTDLSRRPKDPYRRIPSSIEDEVYNLRMEYMWGPDKISGYMKRKGIVLGQSTVYRILKKKGVNRPLEKPRRKLKYIRWERETPNDLWQCDWKYVKELNKWLCAYMDDHSRFIVSARLYDNATTENTIDCLLDGVKRYGTPRQILTDHGVQFYAMRHGESMFDKILKEMGIEHVMSGIGKPTTTGKIERFFATYSLEAGRYKTLEYFIHYYNFIRPHQSPDCQTPAERCGRSVS